MAKIISGSILRRPLEVILEEKGLLGRDALQEAAAKAQEAGLSLEEFLVHKGEVPQEPLFQAVAEAYGLPYASLEGFQPLQGLGSQIEEFCARESLLAIGLEEGLLTLATSRPAGISRVEGQIMALGFRCRFAVTSPDTVARYMVRMIDEQSPDSELFSGISELAMSFDLDETRLSGKKSVDLSDAANQPSIIQLVNKALILAISQRSSDIHVESTEKGIRIRYRIDGVLTDRIEVAAPASNAFISRVMVMAGLDITERMMPQDGSFKGSFDGREVEFRIATIPGSYGQNITLRILSTGKREKADLSSLGFRDDERAIMNHQTGFPHGMVLVSGPTGSGKSTTLYAILEELAKPSLKLITIEDPIERRLDRVQQIQVRVNRNDPERSLTFARGLRSILRLDPDIIMVGEIRDRETAEISVQASLTGHLVLSTVHANSAVETVRRVQNIGVDQHMMLSSINLIMAQRLLRRLCPKCRIPRDSTSKERTLFAEHPGFQLYEAGGCPACLNTGFKGRIGVFEFLSVTDDVRSFLLSDLGGRKSVPASFLLRDLRASAIFRVAEGTSSLSEARRVLGPCL